MSNEELLTDEYVAELLAKEASTSLKYSSMGLEAFESSKKPANKPKPNTRFLQHIIKDTDHHNKTLLAKEQAEAKARLRDLRQTQEERRVRQNPNQGDIRRRQLGDIQSILGGGRKRRKPDQEERPSQDEGKGKRRRDDGGKEDREPSTRHRDLVRNSRDERQKQSERLSPPDDRHTGREGSRRSHRRSRRDSHTDESLSDDERQRSRKHRHRHRSRSRSPRRREKSRSPRERSRRTDRQRSPAEHKSRRRPRSPAQDTRDESDGSDPLEELMGPAPPPTYRGRGTVGGGINMRFSELYDPAADTSMAEEEEEKANAGGAGWDDAVEAFRDRQRMKQNLGQRLREAGFEDKQIQRLEGDGGERAEEVRWASAGEKREWDLGKDDG